MNKYSLHINNVDYSDYAGELEWGDDLSTLSTELSFKLAGKNINAGDKFLLKNKVNSVFKGIITDESYTATSKIISYSGFDYGFFLNKNEVIIQFNGISATQAIKQLLTMVSVSYGSIPEIPVIIKKIYKDQVVSDIMKDILDQVTKKTGKKYFFEAPLGIVNVYQIGSLVITPYYQLSGDTGIFAIQNCISSFSATNSIQDLKNSIIVTDNSEKIGKAKYTAKSSTSIAKFGLLQQVELSDGNSAEQNHIAKTLLADLNKVSKTRSVELFGTDDVKAGRILSFNCPKLDFSGKYLIKSSKHRILARHHKVSLELEAWNG